MEHTFNLRQISAFKVTLAYKSAKKKKRKKKIERQKDRKTKKESKKKRKKGIFKQIKLVRAVVAHAFNPSTWEAETDRLGFKASLAYRVSSRTASVTQRNCIMKKKQKTKMN